MKIEVKQKLNLVQGKNVPNRAYVLNLTLSVRFGHKYYDRRFSNFSCAGTKYQIKETLFQNIIKNDENYILHYLLLFENLNCELIVYF